MGRRPGSLAPARRLLRRRPRGPRSGPRPCTSPPETAGHLNQENENMKVFVTGHRGYIGSHLVDVLKQEGHAVVGCDVGLFDGCQWEPLAVPDVELAKDLRAIEAEDLD